MPLALRLICEGVGHLIVDVYLNGQHIKHRSWQNMIGLSQTKAQFESWCSNTRASDNTIVPEVYIGNIYIQFVNMVSLE